MNAPLVHPPVLNARGEALSPIEAWRAIADSERARPLAGKLAAEPLGHTARRLFRQLGLYDAPRHPRVKLLHVPVLRHIGLGIHAAYCLALLGKRVTAATGKSRGQQLREIIHAAAVDGLDAQTYYMQELYRPGSARRAGETLTRHETKNGLMTALRRLAPQTGVRTSLGDKLAFHARCRLHGIPTIPILLAAADGALDRPAAFARGEDLFLKPRHGKGARGAEMLQHLGNNHYRDGDGRIMTAAEIGEDLARRSLATPYLLQPRLTNHAEIADLATDSLLVMRVVTCLDENGAPVVTHGMLRVIGKLEPGWNDTAEYAAPIDLATGRMGAMTGDKLGGALDWHDRHPITGAPVKGRLIAAWPEICRVALTAHRAFADRLLLGWDIAVTPQGVIVVEGNALPDVAFLQRVHRQAIGDSPLGPLLRGHLQKLEKRAH